MNKIIEESLYNSYSFEQYIDLLSQEVEQIKQMTETDEKQRYTVLNLQRMKRLCKTIEIEQEAKDKLKGLKPQKWLVISEGWCGDASQILPVIEKMAEQNPNIELTIALRDKNEPLMDLFLTNGARSIPKLIALDKDNRVLFSWGPRPKEATSMVEDYKRKHGSLSSEFKEDLQRWYNADKGKSTVKDILENL